MKLEELFAVLSEHHTVIVCDYRGTELARYDGRNSIPTELNNNKVLNVFPHNDDLYVIVETR